MNILDRRGVNARRRWATVTPRLAGFRARVRLLRMHRARCDYARRPPAQVAGWRGRDFDPHIDVGLRSRWRTGDRRGTAKHAARRARYPNQSRAKTMALKGYLYGLALAAMACKPF